MIGRIGWQSPGAHAVVAASRAPSKEPLALPVPLDRERLQELRES
jgi:hypothetical protein